jgi:transcription elongation factor Elf1
MELLVCPECESTAVQEIAHQGQYQCGNCDEISEYDELKTITTKSFTCSTCDHEFASANGLGLHVGIAHRECSLCGETFGSHDALDEHLMANH